MGWEAMLGIFGSIFGIVGGAFAIYFGIKTKNARELSEQKAVDKDNSAVLVQLGIITSKVDDIKDDNKEIKRKMEEQGITIAKLETKVDGHISNKSLHARAVKNN